MTSAHVHFESASLPQPTSASGRPDSYNDLGEFLSHRVTVGVGAGGGASPSSNGKLQTALLPRIALAAASYALAACAQSHVVVTTRSGGGNRCETSGRRTATSIVAHDYISCSARTRSCRDVAICASWPTIC